MKIIFTILSICSEYMAITCYLDYTNSVILAIFKLTIKLVNAIVGKKKPTYGFFTSNSRFGIPRTLLHYSNQLVSRHR